MIADGADPDVIRTIPAHLKQRAARLTGEDGRSLLGLADPLHVRIELSGAETLARLPGLLERVHTYFRECGGS